MTAKNNHPEHASWHQEGITVPLSRRGIHRWLHDATATARIDLGLADPDRGRRGGQIGGSASSAWGPSGRPRWSLTRPKMARTPQGVSCVANHSLPGR